MNVEKNEQLGRSGLGDFGQSGKRRNVCNLRPWRAVDRPTHVVTAGSKLRQRAAIDGHDRGSVGGTMIDGGRAVVLEQKPLLDVGGGGVQRRNARTPGQAANDRNIIAINIVNKIIWRQPIIVISRIEMPAELKLFEIVEAGDIERLRFRPAQSRQEEARKDRNDRDDDQQFNQCKRPRAADSTIPTLNGSNTSPGPDRIHALHWA